MAAIKFTHPRFYFKKTAQSIFITHRLTHAYITSVDTEKELKAALKELNKMSVRELWEMLIDKHVTIPQKNESFMRKSTGRDENEEWFEGAWSVYTDLFYSQNKSLLIIDEEIPYEVINTIRKERYLADKEKSLREDEEKRQAEKAYLEEQKQRQAELKKQSTMVKEVAVGKIGSTMGIEKLKSKTKKMKKKAKVTTRLVNIPFIDSESLF